MLGQTRDRVTASMSRSGRLRDGVSRICHEDASAAPLPVGPAGSSPGVFHASLEKLLPPVGGGGWVALDRVTHTSNVRPGVFQSPAPVAARGAPTRCRFAAASSEECFQTLDPPGQPGTEDMGTEDMGGEDVGHWLPTP